MRFSRIATAAAFVCTLGLFAPLARAVVFTYTVQPSSSLTVTGTLFDQTLTPQTVNSNITTYGGSIFADVTATTIRFTGGSTIDANLQALNQQPAANGNPGSAAADYGFSASIPVIGTGFAAARNFAFDVTSNPIPFAGVTFVQSSETLTLKTGVVDYRTPVTFDRFDASGLTSGNSGAVGALTLTGNTQTLTMPINITLNMSLATTNDTSLNFTGSIVATRLVPEPSSALLGVAMAGLAIVRRSRK